ncbi:MAG: hypothetical protein ACOYEK_09305 [bacterium]|jgi:hypothetical protein
MRKRWILPYKVYRGRRAEELVKRASLPAANIYSWVSLLCQERGWETIQIMRLNLGPPSFIVQGPQEGPVAAWVLTGNNGEVTYVEAWEWADPPSCTILTSPDSRLIHPFLHWLQSLVLRPHLVAIPGGKE